MQVVTRAAVDAFSCVLAIDHAEVLQAISRSEHHQAAHTVGDTAFGFQCDS